MSHGNWIFGFTAWEPTDVGFNVRVSTSGATGFRYRGNGNGLEVLSTNDQRYHLIKNNGDTEIGSPAVASGGGRSLSFMTSGNTTYDARFLATAGTGAGDGTLNIAAGSVTLSAILRPGSDNTRTLGSASFRWSTVYAATGTINTSDERAKEQIGAIPDEWLDAWGDVERVRYKFKDAVAEKGDRARWHVGLIAQQIERAFAARGLDAFQIGLLCRDDLEETYTRTITEQRPVMQDVEETYTAEEMQGDRIVIVSKTRTVQKPLTRTLPVIGEDGQPLLDNRDPAMRTVEVTEDVEVEIEETRPSGKTRYGVRYDEAAIMEAEWLRRELRRVTSG